MYPRHEQFLRERQYLVGVSARTIEWYRYCLDKLPTESPSQDDLRDVVLRLREKGHKPTGVNGVIQALNAYAHWANAPDVKCGSACRHPKLTLLKVPDMVPPTFTERQIKMLVAWKPRTRCQRRLHLLVLFLLDTGCRISEALSVRGRDVDLDNLLVTLDGKGRKQRVVPISFELRKSIFRYTRDYGRKPDWFLLAEKDGGQLERRNTLRDVKSLCRRLGFDPPPRTCHAFRHSFALFYLKRGGSAFHLQRCLGHSSLDMTKRYVALTVDDLQAVHERVSLLTN